MSNSLAGRLWTVDTVGVLTHNPITIERVIFFPSAANNELWLTSYNPNSKITVGCKSNLAGSITGTRTFTSAGNIPAGVVAGSVFELLHETTLASSNTTEWADKVQIAPKRFLVTTAGDTNAVIVENGAWGNEGPLYYDWATYTGGIVDVHINAGAGDKSPVTWWAPEGWRSYPNLILQTITAGSAEIYIK